jgi:dTDP-4-dehydrorhamnose reductase
VRNPIQVGDLADAILELVASDAGGPLHVAGSEPVNRHEFAQLIVRAYGADPSALVAGDSGPQRPGDCTLDCSAARRLLQTPMRGVRTVLGTP